MIGRISTTQAGYLLGIDRRAVRALIAKGQLSAVEDGNGWRWLDEAEVLARRREDPLLADLRVPEVRVRRRPRLGIDLIDTEEY